MKRIFGLFILCMFLCLAGNAWSATASGNITMSFDLSRYDVGREVKLWIPYPISSEYQDISNIKIDGDYVESAVYTDKKYQTPMLFARWSKGAAKRQLTFSFDVRRQEVLTRNLPTEEQPWNAADYKQWLQATSRGPITGTVKELADKITAGKTTVLGKAKAIYDWVCENMYRDPATVGCGPGDVCALLTAPGGKCTDIHSVYVALCRAAGVPAREIFGIRLGKEAKVDISKWEHCWAEFYLPGFGWVPVDPADVRKLMLKGGLPLGDPKTEELRRYFWGGWDAYRVKWAMGRDVMLNPAQAGESLNTFGYPYAEVDGKPLDFYDPATFSYSIMYRQ